MAEASVVTGVRVAAAALFFLVARAAEACPACTTRGSGGYLIPLLLGAMISTPYIVATVVLRIVRKAEAERHREDAADSASLSSERGALDSAAPAKA
jgi:hypothetical protein